MTGDVDLFLTPSETLRRTMVAWGLPESRIERLPQGLDHAPWADLPRAPRTGPVRLAFLGTVAPHKGVDVLVRAVAALPPDAVRLVVHGPEAQHRDYAARCRALAAGAPDVRFGGPLSREDMREAYREIDVLCVPSLWNECCPLTIQEAFIAGVPCVVSDLGGMAELVAGGRGGLLADPGDAGDWTRVLRRLADEPGLLARLTESVPAVPTLEEHAARLVRIYGREG